MSSFWWKPYIAMAYICVHSKLQIFNQLTDWFKILLLLSHCEIKFCKNVLFRKYQPNARNKIQVHKYLAQKSVITSFFSVFFCLRQMQASTCLCWGWKDSLVICSPMDAKSLAIPHFLNHYITRKSYQINSANWL